MRKYKFVLINTGFKERNIMELYTPSGEIKDILISYFKNGVYSSKIIIISLLWDESARKYSVIPDYSTIINNMRIRFDTGMKEHNYKCSYTLISDEKIMNLQMGFVSNFDFKIFSACLKDCIKNTEIIYSCFARNTTKGWIPVVPLVEKEK